MARTTTGTGYIEWGAVAAGSAIALAVSIILLPFGNAIGLSVDAEISEENARGMIIGIGLWMLWVQLIASMLGGYMAGRMIGSRDELKNHENEFRDGLHGLIVWAVSTVLIAIGTGAVAALAALTAGQGNEVSQQVLNEEISQNMAVIFSFATAGTAIVAAVAAWIFATIGGDHRDDSVDLSKHLSFRTAKKK